MKRRMLSLFMAVAALALTAGFGTGCTTVNGKKVIDVAKAQDVRAAVNPIFASGLRRALEAEPAHAQEIATYVASVGSLFCQMKATKSFSVDFLVAEADKLTTPHVKDNLLLDIKNGVVAVYRIAWNDRLHAELPEEQWLYQVSAVFCDGITTGLNDARSAGLIAADFKIQLCDPPSVRAGLADGETTLTYLITPGQTADIRTLEWKGDPSDRVVLTPAPSLLTVDPAKVKVE
jgi:hypothetical protein